jgi:hypothetical protein
MISLPSLRHALRAGAPSRARVGRALTALLLVTVTLAAHLPADPARAASAQTPPVDGVIPPIAPVPGPGDSSTTSSTVPPAVDPSSDSTTTVVPPAVDPEAPPPVVDPRLSPALANVAVEAPAYQQAAGDYAAAWRAKRDVERRQSDAEAALTALHAAEARLRPELNEYQRRHDKSAARLVGLRRSLQKLAVATYMRGGRGSADDTGLDPNTATRQQAAKVMVDSVNAIQLRDIEVHEAIVSSSQQIIDSDSAALAEVLRRIDEETALGAQAISDLGPATDRVTRSQHSVADTHMTAMVTGTDLSLVALDAYWRAAESTAVTTPACRLRWSAIAGIGRVETVHGRYGGGPVDGNGNVDPPIIGIALDGTHNTVAIPDTDGGSIDTDPVWDRAVGPMAFIPTSWRAYGKDGNGDGIKDVENIYDATLATAGLLCGSGPLDTDAGLRSAYFRYNQSQTYVDMVLGFTHDYDQLLIPPVTPPA